MSAATRSATTPPALAFVTHQSRAWLERLLPGMVDSAHRLDAPLVAVDNASTDGTLDLLDAWAKRADHVAVVRLAQNLGYAAGVNAAFDAAPGRDVMLVNPDVELSDPEPVRRLVRFLDQNPRVGAVGPRLAGEQGETQPSARRFPTLLAMVGSLSAARRVRPALRSYEHYMAPSAASSPNPVDWVVGAAMLIRRRAFDSVGGWDEGFFLYVEDADFCRRLRRHGWEVIYHPGVLLRHAYARASSASDASALSSVARRSHIAGLARFWAKDPLSLIGLSPARTR